MTLGTAVNAAAINDLGQAVFIWNAAGGIEHLFFAADASNLAGAVRLLSTDDLVDVDGDTIADFQVTDFNASTVVGPGLDLAEDSFIYVEVDLAAVGPPLGPEVEAIIRLGLPVPDIAVAPTSHDYGMVTTGMTASHSFTVENVGGADLSVASTVINGDADFQIVAGGGAFVLAPGETEVIEVEFTPAAPGGRNADLEIASDDPDTPLLAVALSGEGVAGTAPAIAVTPPSHDYGAVAVGGVATQAFTVENTGTADLDVTSTVITGIDAIDFQIAAGGAAFTLAPGMTQVIDIEFAPGSLGAKSAGLEIASNDPGAPLLVVPLAGEGTAPFGIPAAVPVPTASPLVLWVLTVLLLGLGVGVLRLRTP